MQLNVENLPESVYVVLGDENNTRLWEILQNKFSIKETAKKIGVSPRNLYKWKEGMANYPSFRLVKLLELASLSIKKAGIKTSRDGGSIQVKFPIEFDEDMAELIGHVMGDGGIDHYGRVHYTTDSKLDVQRFQKLVQKVFGKTKVEKRIQENKTTLYYPKILGTLLSSIAGLDRGSKVITNCKLSDKFIKQMSDEMKKRYLSALYECDGQAERVSVVQAGCGIKEPPKRLIQMQDLLKDLGFKKTTLKSSSIYTTSSGTRRRWVLKIDGEEKEKFLDFASKFSRKAYVLGLRIGRRA